MRPALLVRNPQFVVGAARPDQFPQWDRPEVAFGGRSNVGKSSLLRSLLGSRRLVRVSGRPGRTQQVNFFQLRLGDHPCAFVDLPGYGFARAPGAVQALWAETVETYVMDRAELAGLILLVDARRGPEEEEVAVLGAMADRDAHTLTVYTKIDKIPKNRRGAALSTHQRRLGLRGRPLVFSALSGEGRDQVLRKIQALVAPRAASDPVQGIDSAPLRGVGDDPPTP